MTVVRMSTAEVLREGNSLFLFTKRKPNYLKEVRESVLLPKAILWVFEIFSVMEFCITMYESLQYIIKIYQSRIQDGNFECVQEGEGCCWSRIML